MSRSNRGAGCVFRAADTGRLLLQRRSKESSEGGTWGCWGGGSDVGESPEATLVREVREEAEKDIAGAPGCPLLVFEDPDSGYAYHNFLIVVPSEFDPITNWETEGWGWFPTDKLPDPLHFGLEALFDDPESLAAIEGGYSGLSYVTEMNHALYKYRRRAKKERTQEEAIRALQESGLPFGFGMRDGVAWAFVGEGFPDELEEDRLDGRGDTLIEAVDGTIDAYCDGIRNIDIQLAEVLDEMSSTCGMSVTPAVTSPPRSTVVDDEDEEEIA